ncbi:MAG: hypothetical protein BWX80_03531 [Candidatus Hydrogenedentes bacterium ADurb.Bin101]|nr:MAG: hypothetical protein BWX80_03531 [Candidatus Hydrogenedentes bacterium ADurb.Bin101]
MTKADFEINGGKYRFITVGFDAMCAYGRAHDVKMGIIHGICLFGRSGDHAEGLRIEHLMAAVGRFADLAHADAPVHTGNAQS